MKMDQVAFYCATEDAERRIKESFGLAEREWINDEVTANSIVMNLDGSFDLTVNKGLLQFNYDLGVELEILRYTDGLNWVQQRNGADPSLPFVNHVGIHLGDDEEFPDMPGSLLVQETRTISHTSAYLTKEGSPGFGRLYHYKIWELQLGSYVKYIRRINPKKALDDGL